MDLWQICTRQNTTTNCAVPQYILHQAFASGVSQLPLLFKITDPATGGHVISAADEFFESKNNIIHLSPVVIQQLGGVDRVTVEMVDVQLTKGKTIHLEPLDKIFYKLKCPQKALERHLKNSYVVGVGYVIPIELHLQSKTQIQNKIINVRIIKLVDEFDKEVAFANINNIDLNVILPDDPPQPQLPSYDPSKQWVPFCGWGRVLSSGEYVKGYPQK
jgi:hypothetical protein